MVESLENRCLLSATLSAGVLNVTGTPARDNIHAVVAGKNLNVVVNGTKQSFNLSDVKSLVVKGLAGDDNIGFGYGTPGATIDGGDGNDHLIGTSNADTIDGGAGNDWIHAWMGNDVVNGGEGNDTLIGCHGNDTIRGGNGNDLISGSFGDDQVFGDAGNDTLFGGPGNDKVDGGAGADATRREGTDVLTSVETVWK